ncbi:hypothetical protein L9F63_021127 [Diploptera punctata]|uniref:Uncharacterized protein n=1 Tax=Diploptera punctata TaxID=6984 RepID=A0AAD8ECA5_DIPPU|nr:hypothetical protein L9F63_021127 [Diploptera punctata]
MATIAENPTANINDEEIRCFVCDVTVTGRYYTLATCRTQSTKMRLIEKLGQLVGERYMVVISEDDIICRGCANLMNTLDRLETEMGSVRNVVLRFLEKKYSLEEGELLNNKTTGFCPPPQITPRNPSLTTGSKSTVNTNPENFMARKRKAALAEMENEQENSFTSTNTTIQKNDPKSNVWMQCDRCKYTTHYNAFMIHHIRQHVKKKNPTCDFCGEDIQAGGSCARQCGSKKPEETRIRSSSNHYTNYISAENGVSVDNTEPETVEMIAEEIKGFKSQTRCTESPDVVISTVQTNISTCNSSVLPTLHEQAIIIDQNHHEGNGESKGDEVTIEMAGIEQSTEVQLNEMDGSTPTAICVMDMSEDSSAEQPRLLTVQKMEEEGNAVYVQVVEVGKGEETDERVIAMTGDGNCEMVEVMWDDVVPSDVGTEQDIHFG